MIQVLHRAFDILEFIAKDPEKVYSLSEIADQFSLNHATCANIIKTLVQRRYVEQIGAKKGYRLGAMSYFLSGNFSYRKDLVNAAKDEMQLLTDTVNENTLLAVLQADKRICLYTVEAKHDLQVRTSQEKHICDTATGKLLLAYASDQEKQNFIQKYGLPKPEHGWNEITDEQSFYNALDRIKQAGVATQLTSAYIFGLAVPLHKEGKVVAALGLFLPEMRYRNRENQVLEALQRTALRIEKKL